MRPGKVVILCVVLFLYGQEYCFAQTRKSPKSSRFSVPKVGRNKAHIMCPIFVESQYPYQGLGFKLGDPSALTYKYYPSKHWAFAADAGKAASGLYNGYYRSIFAGYLPAPTQTTSYSYLTHKANTDWFLEAKFLYQWNTDKVSKGMQFYTGLGWQWRSTGLTYDFLTQTPVDSKFAKISKNRFTYGPVAIIGFEYSYFSLPLSAFIEVELFTDALVDPGYHRFQGGTGLRYVF